MKTCNVCGTAKPLSEFDKKKDGRISGYCKSCRREKIRKHYKDNVDYYVKKARKHNQSYTDRFDEYKRSLSCTDCGMSFKDAPYLCDFHHLNSDNKEYNVGHMRASALRTIMEEVKKCVPLCANCHRKRHNAPLAKLDTAPEYESGDLEGSNPSRSTESSNLSGSSK